MGHTIGSIDVNRAGTASEPHFPIELTLEIFLVVAWSDQLSLLSCRLVSRTVNSFVEPVFYRSIAITSDRHIEHYVSLVRDIKSDSPLRHVRHAWLGTKPGTSSLNSWGQGWNRANLKKILFSCSLRRLDIERHWRDCSADLLLAAGPPEELSCSMPGGYNIFQRADIDVIIQSTKRLHLFHCTALPSFNDVLDPLLQSSITHMDLEAASCDIHGYLNIVKFSLVSFLSRFKQLRILLLRFSSPRVQNDELVHTRPTAELDDLKTALADQEGQLKVIVITGSPSSMEFNEEIWAEAAAWNRGEQDIWKLVDVDDGSRVRAEWKDSRVWRVM